MKVQFAGRVICHELVEGEKPKTDCDRIKVKVAVRPVGKIPGNSGTMTFALSSLMAQQDFPLKKVLMITCQEGQEDLFDSAAEGDEASPRPRRDPAQGEIGLPRGDSPVARAPEGPGESLARHATGRPVTPLPTRGGRRRNASPRAN